MNPTTLHALSYNGRTYLPGQANNFYIFPAVGMAIFATKASRVTDAMFIEAAAAAADQVSEEQRQQGLLYPLQSNILENRNKDRGPGRGAGVRSEARPRRSACGYGSVYPPARLQTGLSEAGVTERLLFST